MSAQIDSITESAYAQLGASASKAGLFDALNSAGLAEGTESYFCKLNADLAGDNDYRSFLHCDGAGTKCIVAYLMYRETGDPSHLTGLAQDAIVMNLDDTICLGTPQSLVLGNTIQRNARLVPDDALAAILKGYKETIDKFIALGIPIALAGGETADSGDSVRTLLVDASLAGRISTAALIDPSKIAGGDILIGLSSTGKASYEDVENSGIASNGLTLARHSLLSIHYKRKYSEVVDPAVDAGLTYNGPFLLSDIPDGLPVTVGTALLSPTRTFAPVLMRIYKELQAEVHAVIHLTGGAQTKILRFGQNKKYIKDRLFPVPTLFSLIQKNGNVSWKEMYQVFNMGHRIELAVGAEHLQTVVDIAKEFSIEAQQIGHVEDNSAPGNASGNVVELKTEHGDFSYS